VLNSVSPLSRAGHVEVRTSGTSPTSLGTLAVAVVIVVGLYFGREVFVPMALAILLSFALEPPVLLLRRWHLGRVPAVIAVLMLAFLIIGGIGTFVGTQLTHSAGDLPEYQTNIGRKIHSVRHTTSKGGIVDRTSEMVNNLSKEIAKPTEAGGNTTATQAAANSPSANQQSPVPVEVRQATSTPLQLIYEFAAPLLQPLATAGIVVVFVIFFCSSGKICETGLSGSPGLEIFGAQLWRWTMPPDALAVISLRRRRSTRASACWWVADCGLSASPTQHSGASSECCCASFPTSARSSPQRFQ
jgi:AI-2E family transporter